MNKVLKNILFGMVFLLWLAFVYMQLNGMIRRGYMVPDTVFCLLLAIVVDWVDLREEKRRNRRKWDAIPPMHYAVASPSLDWSSGRITWTCPECNAMCWAQSAEPWNIVQPCPSCGRPSIVPKPAM